MSKHASPAESTPEAALVMMATTIAIRGANEYLRVHRLTADRAALAECLHSWVRITLPEALNDAKAAIECNMPQVAEQTFSAAMILAGVEAAREAGS